MKYLYHFLMVGAIIASCGATAPAQNTMYINGHNYAIDTIIPKHSVGPGCEYAFYRLPDCPMTIHVLEMDLTNPYVDMQVVNASNAALGTEQPSKMYARFDAPGHDMIASHNGDLFTNSSSMYKRMGLSRTGLICDGEITVCPVSQPLLYLTPDRKPYIDRVHFNSSVTHKGTKVTLNGLNMPCLEYNPSTGTNFLSLYTKAWGGQIYEYYTGGKIAILKPRNGESFKYPSNATITAVVESVKDNPGNPTIPNGCAVLHGVGTSADFIESMTAGDEITINIRTSTNGFPDHIDIDEAIGSEIVILQNGEVPTIGNPELHPRTFMGINKEKTKIYSVVVDGRQSLLSVGISLDDEGYVLKALGAWDGVNLDGGGSSIMYINEEIKNSPSEASERYVGNGVIFFSKAPVDDNFATLAFEPRAYNIPISSTFRPIVYAYNQYGLLKSKDVSDAVVTCDPHIGTMKDGIFTATDQQATGYIYATHNGLTTKQLVSTVMSEVRLINDSYVVDDRRGYPIQMDAKIGNFTYEVNAATVDWASSDPDVAEVIDGKIYGYKNGAVSLTGTSSNFNGSLNITVEIPENDSQAVDPIFDASSWSLKQGGGKNIAISQNGTGFDITYTGSGSARNNYITLAKTLTTYGLPYGVRFDINPGDATITNMQIAIADKLGNRGNLNITNTEIPKNTLTTFIVPFSEIVDITNNASYPITISNLRFDMSKSDKDVEYKIQVPCYEQLYSESSGVETIINNIPSNSIKLYPNPAVAGTPVTIECEGAAQVEIYNIGGALIKSVAIEGTTAIETADLNKGIYIVRVVSEDAASMGKLIIK